MKIFSKCSRGIFISGLLFFSSVIQAQDNLNLNEMLGKIDSSNIFMSKDYYTWCGSVIRGDDGKFYMFYSRWSHGVRKLDDDSLNYIFNGFSGWMKYSEIAIAVSEKLQGPYKHITTVLKGSGKEGRWDRFTMHNPHIQKFDGYYYLYYTSSAYDTAFQYPKPNLTKEMVQWYKYNCTQSIGVVKVKSINDFISGNFKMPDMPIVSVDKIKTFEVANNQSVAKGPDGKYYMMYKSRKSGGHMTFWWAVADKPDDPFTTVSNVTSEADMACEDPFIWYDKTKKSFFAVAKYFSQSKKYDLQFGSLVLLSSKKGTTWSFPDKPEVSKRVLYFKEGSSKTLTHLERPFIYRNEKGKPIALFAAASFDSPGRGDLLHVDDSHNTFNVCIPLLSVKQNK